VRFSAIICISSFISASFVLNKIIYT
jgi:hypothetical protein